VIKNCLVVVGSLFLMVFFAPLKTLRNWTQEEVGVAVSNAVGVKATKKTAHRKMVREFSLVGRRRIVYVEMMVPQCQVRVDSQLSTLRKAKPGPDDQPVLEMGAVTVAMLPIPLCCASMPS